MRRSDELDGFPDPTARRAGSPVDLPRDRIAYQSVLRSLGAHLDDLGARRINLLETEDGYAVRYQPDPRKPEIVLLHMSMHDLLILAEELERKRRRKALFGSKTDTAGKTYENVLRALGYELDQAEAYSILVDEIDEGMLVTYQYLNPIEGFNARKRMVILGSNAVHSVLSDAESRREQRKRGIMTMLAG